MRFLLLLLLISCRLPVIPVDTVTRPQWSADAGARYLVPSIRFDGPVTNQSAATVAMMLIDAKDLGSDAVVLELNTAGGNMEAGFQLSRAIETLGIPVICVVDYQALSMGIFILQSCTVRLMTSRSVLMAHGLHIAGNDNRVSEEIMLTALNEAWLQHVGARLSISAAELRFRIRGTHEYWLDWREALRVAAVDAVVTSTLDVRRAYEQRLGL